ncbi:MAG TPA: transcriptional regulator [Syntrophomonas sp.]|nr:transcriptional regulator [Syntrophomonas sp.]HRW12070.1 transcriptional regulator [Syntrophomonas sp.]
MEFIRIQDKIISWQKIETSLKKVLQMRARGFSQQEVAERLKIDRTFISRLETLGELRKGQSIACIGFPLSNKEEILAILEKEGVEYIMLMTEQERQDFINHRSGKELLNVIMDLIADVRQYDVVVCIGSDERIRLMEGVLNGQIISIAIGTSPITEDKWLDPAIIKEVLRSIRAAR